MKKFGIQAVALILFIFMALILSTNKFPIPLVPQPSHIKQLQIKNITINAEIADTADKRSKGLSGRSTMATDSGMLFVLSKPDRVPFWMKGMKFALDFIYIRNNKVVDMIKNAQPPIPNTPDAQLALYVPNQLVDSVLEVNAGFIDQNNIQVGDIVTIK